MSASTGHIVNIPNKNLEIQHGKATLQVQKLGANETVYTHLFANGAVGFAGAQWKVDDEASIAMVNRVIESKFGAGVNLYTMGHIAIPGTEQTMAEIAAESEEEQELKENLGRALYLWDIANGENAHTPDPTSPYFGKPKPTEESIKLEMEIDKERALKQAYGKDANPEKPREINLGGAKEKFLGAAHGVMAYADKNGALSAFTVAPTTSDKTAEQIEFIQSIVEQHGNGAKTLTELMNKNSKSSVQSTYTPAPPTVIPGTNRCETTTRPPESRNCGAVQSVPAACSPN